MDSLRTIATWIGTVVMILVGIWVLSVFLVGLGTVLGTPAIKSACCAVPAAVNTEPAPARQPEVRPAPVKIAAPAMQSQQVVINIDDLCKPDPTLTVDQRESVRRQRVRWHLRPCS